MHDLSIYDQQAAVLRLLLQGPSGSGKSCVLGQFPKVRIIDLDRNFKSAADYLRANNKADSIRGIDFADEDDKGGKVALSAPGGSPQFARVSKLIADADADPECETIGLDSGTIFVNILIAETLAKQGKSEMTKREWGTFGTYGQHVLMNLMASRKHVVITIHEKLEKDVNGNVVLPYKVTWPGAIGERLGMFFTNVWRCTTKSIWDGKQNISKHLIQTKPDSNFALKNTLVGLPTDFEFSWDLVEKHLKPHNQQPK